MRSKLIDKKIWPARAAGESTLGWLKVLYDHKALLHAVRPSDELPKKMHPVPFHRRGRLLTGCRGFWKSRALKSMGRVLFVDDMHHIPLPS
jgi:hypothetical protein